MFLAWFEANKIYVEGQNLTYAKFSTKEWKLRKKCYNIDTLIYIPPWSRDLYYLIILLIIEKWCIDYKSIKIINEQIFETYQEACHALGLLVDDKEFIDAIKEASEIVIDISLEDCLLHYWAWIQFSNLCKSSLFFF